MNVSSQFHIEVSTEKLFVGDDVFVYGHNGGGRRGTIDTITGRGVYLDIGNRKPTYYKFTDVKSIEPMENVRIYERDKK